MVRRGTATLHFGRALDTVAVAELPRESTFYRATGGNNYVTRRAAFLRFLLRNSRLRLAA